MDICCAENLFFFFFTVWFHPLLIPSYSVRVPAACSRSPVDQLRLKHQEDRALLTRSTETGRNPPHLQEDTQRHRQRDDSQVQHRRLDKPSDPDPQGTKHHICWVIFFLWLIYPVSILVHLKMKKQTEYHNEMNWLDSEVSTVVTNGLFAWWCQAE